MRLYTEIKIALILLIKVCSIGAVNVNIKMYKKGNISMYKKRNMICTTYESFFMDEEASSVISLVL